MNIETKNAFDLNIRDHRIQDMDIGYRMLDTGIQDYRIQNTGIQDTGIQGYRIQNLLLNECLCILNV